MFKQLKRKLLTINVISISLLLIIAFSSIYFVTYNRTYIEIGGALNHLETFKPDSDNKSNKTPSLIESKDKKDRPNLPDREITFVIDLDNDDTITSTKSFFTEDESFYENAAILANKNSKEKYIELDDSKWAFNIVDRKDSYQIFFIEVTTQIEALNRLAYTFIIVFLVMFILNYIFSNYITNQSIKPVKEAFDKQNQFISDASHELKTPLAIISTNVDVLLNDPTESDKWLNYIKSEVSRMSKLTENLLYLSQFDDHNKINYTNRVNLSEVLEHVLLGMEAIAYEKKRILNYEIEPDLFVKGEQEQLSQVLLILIDNAIKYSELNSAISVNLSSSTQINLTVSNNGLGIAEENIDKIFNRFYKVDKSRSQKSGYGLGLAIASSIISHHKGKITCSSIINEKTTFIVSLPKE